MPSFTNAFIEYTQPYESPTSFWKWAAYSAISATLRDNVWIADGDSRVYPNLYILFLATSGARKDRPIRVIDDLLSIVKNTKVISGRSSIQGILDELSRSETDAKTGKIVQGGSAIWVAPELSAGIVEDAAAVSILTDIYDGKTNFQSVLRHSPKFRIDRIVFSALMASNENMLKGVYDTKATYGGLLARTLLVCPNEIRPPNSLMGMGDEATQAKIKEAKAALVSILQNIANMKGAFHFASDAIQEHEKWYKPFYYSFTKGSDKAGVSARIQTNIKKISMILAANAGEQSIRRIHMEESIEVCTGLLANYNNLIMSTGKSALADASALVIQTLAQQPPEFILSRKELLAMHWSDIDGETLDKVVATLEGGGVLETMASGAGIMLRLTTKTIERMKLRKAGGVAGQ